MTVGGDLFNFITKSYYSHRDQGCESTQSVVFLAYVFILLRAQSVRLTAAVETGLVTGRHAPLYSCGMLSLRLFRVGNWGDEFDISLHSVFWHTSHSVLFLNMTLPVSASSWRMCWKNGLEQSTTNGMKMPLTTTPNAVVHPPKQSNIYYKPYFLSFSLGPKLDPTDSLMQVTSTKLWITIPSNILKFLTTTRMTVNRPLSCSAASQNSFPLARQNCTSGDLFYSIPKKHIRFLKRILLM